MPPFLADVLTWPGNSLYVTAIKTARSFSVAPTVLILNSKQPVDGWSILDKKLAIALQILEDETCPDCGVPIWIGHSDDKDIQFDIKSRTCYACASIEGKQEVEAKRASKRKGKSSSGEKGKKRFIVREPSEHVPTRSQYYKAQQELE